MTFSSTSRLLAPLLLSLSVQGAAFAEEVDGRVLLESCSAIEYPRESSKYGLAGVVKLGFDLNPMGMVENLTMIKGTGWAVVDEAVFNTVAKCQFPAEVAATKKKFAVHYVVKPHLANPGVIPPVIRQDTCPASDIFSEFVSWKEDAINTADGVALRFEVDEVGRTNNIQFEDRAWDAHIINAARTYMEACRFTPSKRAGVKGRGATSGRLTLKAPAAK